MKKVSCCFWARPRSASLCYGVRGYPLQVLPVACFALPRGPPRGMLRPATGVFTVVCCALPQGATLWCAALYHRVRAFRFYPSRGHTSPQPKYVSCKYILSFFVILYAMKILLPIFIGLLSFSCNHNQEILEGKSLDPEKKYLLVIDPESGDPTVVTDNEAILKYVKNIEIETSESCEGTTPDYLVFLFEDGECIESWPYCSFELFADMDIGKLEKYTRKAKDNRENGLSKAKYHERLIELKKRVNVYLTKFKYDDLKEEGEVSYFSW